MSDTKKTLAQRLVIAMRSIDAVTKSGFNERQKYNYVKAADVANEVRKVLCDEGIAFTYSADGTDRWEKPTNGGGTLFFCEVKATFRFIDQDSGETLEVKGVGWGADSLDKAPYKAMTGALKYALRMNFLIPDEEDPEKANELYESVDQRPSRPAFVQPLRAATPIRQQPANEDAEPDGPLFDENGNIVEAQSTVQHREQKQTSRQDKPTKEDRRAKGWISEGQEKRFFFFVKQSGIESAEVKEYLKSLGVSDISQLPWKKYGEAVVWAGGPAEERA